jgi:hypothetical protein
MVAPRTRTYILERPRDFFTGPPDEPCSGAARLVPTDSGAAPLRPATSTAALHSPCCSGANPPTSGLVRVSPWPPPAARETEGTAGQHWNLPSVVRSASTSSPPTSPVTGAFARSLRWGSRSRRRDGRLEPAAPPTATVGRPDEVGLSVPQGRLVLSGGASRRSQARVRVLLACGYLRPP